MAFRLRCGPQSKPLSKGLLLFSKQRVLSASLLAAISPVLFAGTAHATDTGLFGSVNDGAGAYSQSMAIIGITETTEAAPVSSVKWLVNQQCPDGSFMLYRAAGEKCTAPDPLNYTGPDTNTTAVAVVALLNSGKVKQAKKAGNSLLAWQNADGGFPYFGGGESDVNSSGLVTYALQRLTPTKKLTKVITAADTFIGVTVLPCTDPVTERYGLPFQPGATADSMASAQGLLGLAPLSANAGKPAKSVKNVNCDSDVTKQISSYLERSAKANSWSLPNSWVPGEIDWSATSTAVVSLAEAGWSPKGISKMTSALEANVNKVIKKKGVLLPGSIGLLMQAATSAGKNPMSFGGKNLYSLLLSTLTK